MAQIYLIRLWIAHLITPAVRRETPLPGLSREFTRDSTRYQNVSAYIGQTPCERI